MNTDALTSWLRDALLPGILILLGGLLVVRGMHWVEARYRRDIDAKIAQAVDRDDVASESLKRSRAVLQAVGWSTTTIATIAAIAFSLNQLGLPLVTIVAPATVISFAVGFGAQQVVGDLLAGFFLLAERQFGYGDVIRFAQPGQTEGVTGTVEQMTLRVTTLRTVQGDVVIIPNGSLRQVTNLSKEWSRAVVDVPIGSDQDLQHASSIMQIAAHTMTTEEPWSKLILAEPVVAGVESVELGYLRLRVVARTLPGRQFEVARQLRLRLATALAEAGVTTVAEVPGGAA